MSVKAFGDVCERIRKMQLKEGSFVNPIGRLDEDTWIDQATNEQKSQMVIILDEIEYAAGGAKSKETQPRQITFAGNATPQKTEPEKSPNFTGYEVFSGASFF